MKIPPPLAWLPEYIQSMERATGDSIALDLCRTINPLVHEAIFTFNEPPSPEASLGAWNILQIWAKKNDCIPCKILKRSPYQILVHIIVKRRNGPDKEEKP